jgi:MraZ protein
LTQSGLKWNNIIGECTLFHPGGNKRYVLFIGNYSNSIDAKGRCMVPAKFRNGIGEKCLLVKGFDECLYMYSEEGYYRYLDTHINNRPEEDIDARNLQFFFYSNSRELELDGQGRINLPQDYIDYAEIIKDIVNIGFGDRIEIWSREKYDAKVNSTDMNPKKLIGEMLKYVPKQS